MDVQARQTKTIYFSYSRVCQELDYLRVRLNAKTESTATGTSAIAQDVETQLGRFRVWALNLGAHRTGDSMSLDQRLRDAPAIKNLVVKLLTDLASRAMSAAMSTTSPFEDESEISDTDSDLSFLAQMTALCPKSKIEAELSDIEGIITALYRLTMSIQNPTPRDRPEKFAAIDVSHFRVFDVRHAEDKFPSAPEFLAKRLGEANTKRRQILEYLKNHHQKVAEDITPSAQPETQIYPSQNDNLGPMEGSYSAPAMSAKTAPTVLTDFVIPDVQRDILLPQDDDRQSFTSYASSAAASGEVRLRPKRPPVQKGNDEDSPFECQCCFLIIESKDWQSHFFRDLRPYCCTFEHCPQGNHLFITRHEWFSHEMALHRREWTCRFCSSETKFSTRNAAETHIQEAHSEFLETHSNEILQGLLDTFEHASTSRQKCPLCLKDGEPREFSAPKNLRRHLANHMRQLALWVVQDRCYESDVETELEAGEAGEDQLFRAVRNGNHTLVEKLLEDGADASSKDQAGNSALSCAASQGYDSIVLRLLEYQADVKYNGGPLGSPLHGALFSDHISTFKTLLQNAAEIDATDSEGKTLLHKAVERDHKSQLSWVRLLLQNQANPHIACNKGRTPLHCAVERSYTECIALLLEAGANVNAVDEELKTPLHLSNTKESVVLLCGAGANVNAADKNRETRLHQYRYVSVNGPPGFESPDIYQALLEAGADITLTTRRNSTPLYAAIECGHPKTAELYLERGADVNAQGGYYGNPLQAASARGNHDAVEMLLSCGADVNAQGGEFGNALQVAAWGNSRDIVKLLLAHGADVNAQGGQCGTALIAAASKPGTMAPVPHCVVPEIAEMLCDHGAEVNAPGPFGNALNCALGSASREIVEILLKHGADVHSLPEGKILRSAAETGVTDIMNLILDTGKPFSQGVLQMALLDSFQSYRAVRNIEEIVKTLMDAGAVIDSDVREAAESTGNENIIAVIEELGSSNTG